MENIFRFEYKLRLPAFRNFNFELGKVVGNNYSAFVTLKALVDDNKYDMITSNIQEKIKSHLQMLVDEFNRYFPQYQTESKDTQKLNRILFGIVLKEITEEIQEELIEFLNDSHCNESFSGQEEFW